MPFRLKIDDLRSMLQDPEVRKLIEEREEPLDLIFAPEPPIDPEGDREGTRATFRAYSEIGATGLSLRFVHESRSHYVEQMQAALSIASEI